MSGWEGQPRHYSISIVRLVGLAMAVCAVGYRGGGLVCRGEQVFARRAQGRQEQEPSRVRQKVSTYDEAKQNLIRPTLIYFSLEFVLKIKPDFVAWSVLSGRDVNPEMQQSSNFIEDRLG